MASATSRSFYDAVRRLGGDILVRPCAAAVNTFGEGGKSTLGCGCGLRLRAKLPYSGSEKPAVVCGACDRAFDYPRVKRAM